MRHDQKKHKKTDFYKKSKYYQQSVKKYRRIGAGCAVGILLVFLVFLTLAQFRHGSEKSGQSVSSDQAEVVTPHADEESPPWVTVHWVPMKVLTMIPA